MKRLLWLLVLAPGLALAQATGPFGIFGGPVTYSSLPPANLVPEYTYAFTTLGLYEDNGTEWVDAASGGMMTWPSGGAGIPNYSGSSSWGTSYSASNTIPANFISTLNQNTTGTAANLSGTPTLPNGTAATTQTTGDDTTKLATDAFVIANAGSASITPGTTTISGATAPCIITNSTSTTMACVTTSAATQADLAAVTTFTITPTGCTPSAHAGGPFGGTITLASGPCTSIVVTMNGATGFTAPNGYHCSVSDRTALAAGTWIQNWGESASTTTTATIPIPGAAGTTDVISFMCDWN